MMILKHSELFVYGMWWVRKGRNLGYHANLSEMAMESILN